MSFNVAGDLRLSDDGRTIELLEGEEKLRYDVEVALQIFRGEWIYDPVVGVPYLETVFVKGTPLPLIREAFRNEVARIPTVVDIPKVELQFDKSTGKLAVDMLVLGEQGISLNVSTQLGQ